MMNSPTDTDTQLTWNSAYRVDRAVTLGQLGAGRPDLGGWMAQLTGPDAKYGYARAFLPKTWPLVYDKRAAPAFDFSAISAGDILEVSKAHSRSHSDERNIIVVTSIDDAGWSYRLATQDDLKALLHHASTT